MRLGTTYTDGRARLVGANGSERVAAADGDLVVAERDLFDLGFDGDVGDLIRGQIDPAALQAAAPIAPDARLSAPLRPGKIVAVGLNYRDHAREVGAELPERPLLFAKFPSSVIGPDEDIVIDRAVTERVDWEVELAVVIGRRMHRVAEGDALDHVFGYTVANDVSARDVQFADGQWVRGKSLDTFCPLGPVVVTADEIADPQALALQTRVNGEVVQQSSTAEMVFGVAEVLAFCSRSFTLEPGDVVLTGTPWGCGEFMDPPRSLQPGDVVETEVEGIGVLRNPVAAG
jgi:2-keto-4-pentenoate hydratase/2-oxohepta-3-ene-1,7-dioic acid hydratase in catechol pathway